MQKSYECELATHIGPESCGAARKGSVEALTGLLGFDHASASASRFRKAASPASDTWIHFGSGEASAS
jgi:hypothetical protein